ncbi:hypothetical protein ACFSNO_10050 [Streptomyces cirratus]
MYSDAGNGAGRSTVFTTSARAFSISVRNDGGTKIVLPSGWVTASVTPGGTAAVTLHDHVVREGE